MGWVVNATPRPLYPRERLGTHCIGGWVGPRAVLDGCGKSRPHRDSIPGPSSPWRVAVPTELSRPLIIIIFNAVLISNRNVNILLLKMTPGPPQMLISELVDLRFEFEQYLCNCTNKSFHGRSHHTL